MGPCWAAVRGAERAETAGLPNSEVRKLSGKTSAPFQPSSSRLYVPRLELRQSAISSNERQPALRLDNCRYSPLPILFNNNRSVSVALSRITVIGELLTYCSPANHNGRRPWSRQGTWAIQIYGHCSRRQHVVLCASQSLSVHCYKTDCSAAVNVPSEEGWYSRPSPDMTERDIY